MYNIVDKYTKELAKMTQAPIIGWFSYRKFIDIQQLIQDLEKIKNDSSKNSEAYQNLKKIPVK